jgi:hypothetical protein
METIEVKENQLVKIVTESGLDKTKSQVLLENFSNYFELAADWENKAKMLVITNISQIAEMKMADEGRKFLKQKRIEVEKTRKILKENSLREGQTIDSIARILTNLISPIENDLEQKAKYREIKEAELKQAIKLERLKLLEPYDSCTDTYMIGEMSEAGFQNYFAGMKLNYEKRLADERRAEEERLATIEAEKKRQEAIKLENERLKKEAEEKEKVLAEERCKAMAEKKALEEKIEVERQKALEERRKAEAEQQRKFETERKEKERLAEEIRKKVEVERKTREKAEADRKAQITAERKAKLAPDKTKLLVFMQTINDLPRPEVKSIEAADIASKANIFLVQTANFIKENANKL